MLMMNPVDVVPRYVNHFVYSLADLFLSGCMRGFYYYHAKRIPSKLLLLVPGWSCRAVWPASHPKRTSGASVGGPAYGRIWSFGGFGMN